MKSKESANGESPLSYAVFGSRSAPKYFPPGLVGASLKGSPYSWAGSIASVSSRFHSVMI